MSADLKKQTDADLAATGRMIATELGKVATELVSRGVEWEVAYWLNGNIKVEFKRVTTEQI
jgi:hypothetical protein